MKSARPPPPRGSIALLCRRAPHRHAARNDPYREHHHPRYTKLDKVPDDAIRAAGLRFSDAAHDGAFLKRATAPKDLRTRGGAVFDRGTAR